VLLATIHLVWRRGEPPVLMFVCAMQWLQASTAILYANSYGVSLVQAFGGEELERATRLSLVGVLVLAIGMRIALIRAPVPREERHRDEASKYNVGGLFVAYVLAYLLSYVCGELTVLLPAATQL